VANLRQTSGGRRRRANAGIYIKAPHHALTVITENADPSLATQGWIGDKPCLVTVDTTVARPDIGAAWPERQPNQRYTLQTVSGEALPVLKEVFLTLTLKIWVFVTNITNEFILELRAYDASVNVGRQTLRLAEEELSLWRSGAGPRPSRLLVVKDQVIPAQCEGIVMTRLESPLGVENGLVEPSPQAHPPQGLYIARTLVRHRREVPVRVLNDTSRDYKLTKGSPLDTESQSRGESTRSGIAPGPRLKPDITGRDCSGQTTVKQ
jgi:hypothetical protein